MPETRRAAQELDGASRSDLLRQKVLGKVRRAIASGDLKPGARVTERSLCEAYGVSRTVAREVIRQLDAERLGEVVPHQGLRIVRLTEKMVREIYEVRAELEVMILRAFVVKATDRQIDHLNEILKRIRKAALEEDVERIIEHSARFITFMNETADNHLAGEILAHLNARIELLRSLAISWPGQSMAGVDQFDRIFQKVAERDVVNAEIELRRYLQMALKSALRQLNRDTA
ncbi:GntR family transcriptional regulator [Stappia stellulata]|uniref:GntR family transcriptional regulator n=1 Tax=Stappia stellulata TaxID=71235 RepID=UPI001CD5DA92|nr:GntR family transcriptional regulator [Stappia stellulata]MCA1241494.1 GntR family transcriptional regulator [Stappia stellulata]